MPGHSPATLSLTATICALSFTTRSENIQLNMVSSVLIEVELRALVIRTAAVYPPSIALVFAHLQPNMYAMKQDLLRDSSLKPMCDGRRKSVDLNNSSFRSIKRQYCFLSFFSFQESLGSKMSPRYYFTLLDMVSLKRI